MMGKKLLGLFFLLNIARLGTSVCNSFTRPNGGDLLEFQYSDATYYVSNHPYDYDTSKGYCVSWFGEDNDAFHLATLATETEAQRVKTIVESEKKKPFLCNLRI